MKWFHDRRPTYGQDPHVLEINGSFILCESVNEQEIVLSTLDSLDFPRRIDSVVVWSSLSEKQVWAPELHKIGPYWFIYYSSSDGRNENHRNKVLCSSDPFGPYHLVNHVGPDIWGIDLTTFEWDNKRYAVWSGWENNGDQFPQNLYIGEMESPWQVKERFCLSVPELDWETSVAPILEGPQIWIRNGKLSVLYAANASWKQEYSTGMLTFIGNNILDPRDWEKRSMSILHNAGHGCMIGDYFIYHRKMSTFPGWNDREIRSLKIWEPGPWTRVK